MNNHESFDICIIGGCGHVGLPLGLLFAGKGKKVALYDLNASAVEKVNKKVMPFLEHDAPPLLIKAVDSGCLRATTDPSVIGLSKALVLVIGTPVDEHLNPNLHDVMEVIRTISNQLGDDQLIILRSTLYPGATQKINDYLRAHGKRTGVAFCPERIAQGHALREYQTLPQIISAPEPAALQKARELFLLIAEEVVEMSPMEAEMAKLFTNTWRYINFAISNQFFMIATAAGLDFNRIYQGMTKDYPRLQGVAKAGFAAGPCLFKDTMQLSAFSNNNFFLGHAAMLINEGLPNFIIEQLKLKGPLRDKVIGILGMAFKANIDDPRESLSYKLKKLLELEARQVLCSDVYISDPRFIKDTELVQKADVIILATPHKEYKTLNLQGKEYVDIWNFFSQGGSLS
jgi:UDP-N-acetyl-D-mannosaminuronic acid dehydrogenase